MGAEISGFRPLPPNEQRAQAMRIMRKRLTQALLVVEAEWKRVAQPSTRTGHYERSITHRVEEQGDRLVGTVGSNTIEAAVLEGGSGIYGPKHRPIVPVNAKALRFPAGGAQTFAGGSYTGFVPAAGFTRAGRVRSGAAGAPATFIFRRSVRGVKPRHYARRAADQSKQRALGILRQAATDIGHLGASIRTEGPTT